MNSQSRQRKTCRSRAWFSAYAVVLVSVALITFTGLAQSQEVRKGNVLIPASSIEHRKDIGVRAHTNIQILIGPPGGKVGILGGGGPGGGLTPSQIRQVYHLPSTGGSQIIAIVDAFDNPNALADFNSFSSQFGLATETSLNVTASNNKVLQVLYATGTQPGQDSSGGWELEESLDVQWAHAMAPNAKILLVEAASDSFTDLLAAEDVATNYIDANGLTPKEISNSWGGSEFQGEQDFDTYFSGTNAVYFASAGDDGAPAGYPSASPNVVSAGGTSVFTDNNGNFVSESGWSDGGGGPSAVEVQPSYQSNISNIVGSARGTPDLSFEADTNTGVSVYDSFPYQGFSFTWWIVGGTSLSSPSLAGIANLAATAQGSFPAGSQVLLAAIYKNLGTANFRDITTGNNGYAAGVGWDFVTGVGSCLGLGGLQTVSTPVANPQTVTVSHNTATAITLTGTDPDIPPLPLTFAVATQPSNGTLSGLNASTGAVTYTPNAKFQGTDSFTFTVNNGANTSTAATVTLIVAPGTPTANPQTVAVVLGTPAPLTLTGTDPDSPPLTLTFAIATQPANGTLSGLNTSTGAVTYTPNSGFRGTDSFTFTVSNGTNTSSPATVTLNVTAGTPTANAQTVSVAHNAPTKITLTGTDPDTPPLKLIFALSSTATHGILGSLNSATGVVTYTPSSNFQGTDSFTFTVTNGVNKSAPATVTLNVTAGIPTAKAQTVAVAHNTAAAITLTGTDPDNPTLPLTFAIAAQPANGTLSGLNASTGAVTYTPNNNFQGADSFTFTVSNGTNTSAAAKVTLNVAGGTPTANAQTVAIAHNAATKITLTGTDPDSPPLALTFAIASSPAHGILGSLNTATGVVTYTPDGGYQGTDAFTFTVSNKYNKSTPAVVTLNVAAGTPTAHAQTVAVPHNTPKAITLTGTDADSPALPLTFVLGASPTHGTLTGFNSSTGAVTYTPSANFAGTDSFTFTVSNGSATSAAAAVTLDVAAGVPTANSQTVAVAHNTATKITLTGSDPDSPALPLTFAVGNSPAHGSLSVLNTTTGAVTYTPSANYQGVDSFTFTVSNGAIKSAPATVTLHVAAGTPTANAQTAAVAHNIVARITLTGSDPDTPPATLTYAIAASPAHGTLSGLIPSTGVVTYTPTANFQGKDTFTFTVSNQSASSAAATVTLNVAAGTPTANPQTVAVANSTATKITLTGADSDTPALTLTFAIAASPTHGALSGFNAATGAVTYTPSANYQGADSFTFTVSNGTATSAAATVTLNVGGGTPTANPQTVAVAHNTARSITLTGTDPDSPVLTLTYAIASSPAHGVLGALNTSTGTVTYTPGANFAGTDSFTFTVSNKTNKSAPATVTLNVAAGTPTAKAQTVSAAHATAAAITLTGADPDSPPLALTFAVVASPANGALSGLNTTTGAVTYTPNANFQGTDSFTFTVSNGTNTSAPATVTLKVAPGTPTANAQTVSVVVSTPIKITLTGSDPDVPSLALTFAIATGPTHGVLGSLNTATGVVTYTPNAKYSGTDSFTFTVSNGTNRSAPATVTLNIAPAGG